MNLNNILPHLEFSNAELVEIATAMNFPAVKKYLKHQQMSALKDIANGLPKPGESDAEYLRKQAMVIGSLGAIESLLEIEKPDPAQ